MQIGVVGAGYVGLIQAVALAKAGHTVVCVDVDEAKVARLKKGEVPFEEPGVREAMKEVGERLLFTTSYEELGEAGVVFVCVGTPQGENGECDLRFVNSALREVAMVARAGTLVVVKSTTPPGSEREFRIALGREDLSLAVNPEFLRQGRALEDFEKPERLVFGVSTHRDEKILREIYTFVQAPIFVTNIASAQIAKYASNTMLALRLSFMNEVANIAQVTGGHIKDIEAIVGADSRIGKQFLGTGAGFGGSCFPKDVLALDRAGRDHGYAPKLIAPIIEVNNAQHRAFLANLDRFLTFTPETVLAVWGLAFNKGTDDLRESPAVRIVEALLLRGVKIRAYDPVAGKNAKTYFGEKITIVDSKESALLGADALLVLTEWPEFIEADFDAVKRTLRRPIIGDGKHVLPHFALRKKGFTVVGIGL